MQTCIVPVVSYNYAARNIGRCKKTLVTAIVFGMALMFLCTGVLGATSSLYWYCNREIRKLEEGLE